MKNLYLITTQVLFKERVLTHKTKVKYLDDEECRMIQKGLSKKKKEDENFLDFSVEKISKKKDSIFLKDMSIEDFEEYIKDVCKKTKKIF